MTGLPNSGVSSYAATSILRQAPTPRFSRPLLVTWGGKPVSVLRRVTTLLCLVV